MEREAESPPVTLAEALKAVPEFRRQHLREHELVAVLQIAVAAMLCGAKSQYAVAQWAKERLEDAPQLLEALGCRPGKCPSHPTIHRVFKGLDVKAFEGVLGEWLSRTGVKPDEPLAVDGKTLRGIHGEELPGVKEALAEVDLKGKVVMGDALQTQREVCERIVAGGGDYLFPVKEHQPTLLSDLVDAFSPARPEAGSGGERTGP